jgi:hypothetical protein
MEGEHTEVSDATRRAEQDEARAPHAPDRPPTREEAEAAGDGEGADPEVARHYQEMSEIGAEVKGEGQIP